MPFIRTNRTHTLSRSVSPTRDLPLLIRTASKTLLVIIILDDNDYNTTDYFNPNKWFVNIFNYEFNVAVRHVLGEILVEARNAADYLRQGDELTEAGARERLEEELANTVRQHAS